MTEELKWTESLHNFLRRTMVRRDDGCLCGEGKLVQLHTWEARLGPYDLMIVESDLYYVASAETWRGLEKKEIKIFRPDMESAKQALLTQLRDAIAGQLGVLSKAIEEAAP